MRKLTETENGDAIQSDVLLDELEYFDEHVHVLVLQQGQEAYLDLRCVRVRLQMGSELVEVVELLFPVETVEVGEDTEIGLRCGRCVHWLA